MHTLTDRFIIIFAAVCARHIPMDFVVIFYSYLASIRLCIPNARAMAMAMAAHIGSHIIVSPSQKNTDGISAARWQGIL